MNPLHPIPSELSACIESGRCGPLEFLGSQHGADFYLTRWNTGSHTSGDRRALVAVDPRLRVGEHGIFSSYHDVRWLASMAQSDYGRYFDSSYPSGIYETLHVYAKLLQ